MDAFDQRDDEMQTRIESAPKSTGGLADADAGHSGGDDPDADSGKQNAESDGGDAGRNEPARANGAGTRLTGEDQSGLMVQPAEILEQDRGGKGQERETGNFEKALQGKHG